MNSPITGALQWQIACIQCQWQLHIRAMLPLAASGDIAQPDMPIVGFREDYLCEQHLTHAHRDVYVSDTGIDLENAYLRYFTGEVITTGIPVCAMCQQQMQGGQVLEKLPFLIQPSLEVLMWVMEKSQYLAVLVETERRAILSGEADDHIVQQLLNTELTLLQRFYESMCREFAVNPTVVPFLTQTPNSLEDWQQQLADLQQHLLRRRTQLLDRQRAESSKAPVRCPQCRQQSVYLIEAATI